MGLCLPADTVFAPCVAAGTFAFATLTGLSVGGGVDPDGGHLLVAGAHAAEVAASAERWVKNDLRVVFVVLIVVLFWFAVCETGKMIADDDSRQHWKESQIYRRKYE